MKAYRIILTSIIFQKTFGPILLHMQAKDLYLPYGLQHLQESQHGTEY